MPTQSVRVTRGQALSNGEFNTLGQNMADIAGLFHAYDIAAGLLASALAVLVAQGSAPTQAQVTVVNSRYTTLSTLYTTLKANVTGADFLVVVDFAAITSKNALLACWRKALQIFCGSGTVAGS